MKTRYIILIVCLSVIVAGSIAFFGISWSTTANILGNYKQQLNYVYSQNFYELVDNVNDIETDLSKVLLSTSTTNTSKYLSNIEKNAFYAQNNITQLPIEHNTINNTIQFLNQLGGYIYVLQMQIANSEDLTLDDYSQLEDLHDSAEDIKYELNKLSVLISSGNFVIIDNIQDPNVNSNSFSENWSGLNNSTIEYPSLIYDGPFSESTTNKTIKGLSNNEITKETAREKLASVFKNYVINYECDVSGEFDVYQFSIYNENIEYTAQISKRDGVLLQLNSGEESNATNISLTDCESLALNFANELGFENMVVSWSTTSNNFAYITLVPTQNNVLLYPDLIKVKVSQDNGNIIGWEAKNWAYNHVERENIYASIDIVQARMKIDEDMDIRTEKLTIIPNDYVGESLAYEFMCIYNGATYYIYIDANSGEQINVLKVIETDNGSFLL